MKRLLIFVYLVFNLSGVYGQEKRWSTGLSAGYPVTFNAEIEYLSPLLSNRLAVETELFFWIKWPEEDQWNMEHYEALSLKYYIFQPGSGLYASLAYTRYVDRNYSKQVDTGSGAEPGTIISKRKGISEGPQFLLGYRLGTRFFMKLELGYRMGFKHWQSDLEFYFPHGDIQTFTYEGELTEIAHEPVVYIGAGYSF